MPEDKSDDKSDGKSEKSVLQVNILEAKNKLSQLIKAAQAGEEVVIANRGQPVARLVSSVYRSDAAKVAAPESALVAGAAGAAAGGAGVAEHDAVASLSAAAGGGIVAWLESHPLPAYARRSPQEIEAALAEERLAWD